jgi:hypothetical protein
VAGELGDGRGRVVELDVEVVQEAGDRGGVGGAGAADRDLGGIYFLTSRSLLWRFSSRRWRRTTGAM